MDTSQLLDTEADQAGRPSTRARAAAASSSRPALAATTASAAGNVTSPSTRSGEAVTSRAKGRISS
jgi:hypothetical protein